MLFGHGLHDLVGLGVAELDERVFQGHVPHALTFLDLVGADDAAFDQDLGPISVLLRHEDTTPDETSSEEARGHGRTGPPGGAAGAG